ncbi:DUF547 domain-containing protein [uncultured Kriegella sp.]|uniref:DUF547 domain-containing protein n=1 Tax=uncultured Kriegella sp. TaxID=1798910 RepID=UPI0030DB9E17
MTIIKSVIIKSIIFSLFMFTQYTIEAQKKSTSSMNFNQLSERFLNNIKTNNDTSDIRAQLYGTTLEILEENLVTDEQKLAFWVNIYNAYIQVILSENPDLYEDKRDFFKREQIPIAGRLISFEKIEHGIIRKSQWPLGLGLVRKWFPNKFERKLRVGKRDYRIHFALNCGAKDCPPVAIYSAAQLDEQFNKSTKNYLERTSEYDVDKKEVAVTALFNWFRGDFGCKKGVKKILKQFDIITTTKHIDITYKNYDWTLDLNNWIEL